MSEKMYTREQIEQAIFNSGFYIAGADILKRLDTSEKQPTFEEKYVESWTKQYRSRGGALSLAEEWAISNEAHLIASYVSSEIDKLRREIGEGK